jgi:hypothetical protein
MVTRRSRGAGLGEGAGRRAAGRHRRKLGPPGGLVRVGLLGPPGAETLAGVEDHAVDDQEDRRPDRLGEQLPELMLEEQPDQADRDRGYDQEPAQLLVHGLHPPVPDRAEEAADDPHPVAPEVDHDPDRRGHVQAHHEGQVRRAVRGDVQVCFPVPADDRGQQDVVPEAGHREQLGHALDQAGDDGLGIGEGGIGVVHAG